MNHAFTLAGAALVALPSGALWWPDRGLLCVSDLHLGKSERLARRGGALLPPYEAQDTLTRLDADLDATGATRVICLGDSFDDAEAVLGESERLWLLRLMAGRDWTWILGNHDPAPMGLGGAHLAELVQGPLTFRHIAAGGHEVSGHYHPKARLGGTARPCFLIDTRHAILPAYGTYTGGLWCHDPALARLMAPGALAILTGKRTFAIPV
ncbi:ligase-associated DNA damage response endonuclease PdeM [Cereibacter sp. SYSU M97828]|nr:ligase-associated DNA damage response endonuclease PdeM [Cereibacter flavus]